MTQNYELNLDNFEGPIDLLVHLVQQKQINITDVNILDLANQYLSFIQNIQNNDYEIAIEYLVMATSLLLLKTKIILNDPREEVAIKIEKERLLSQLIEYQQFKKACEFFLIKELERKKMFTKIVSDLSFWDKKSKSSELIGHSSIAVLVSSIRKLNERYAYQNYQHATIDFTLISPDEKILVLRELLTQKSEYSIYETIFEKDIKHFLVTLLALLNMSKNQEIFIEQKKDSNNIFFRVRKDVNNE